MATPIPLKYYKGSANGMPFVEWLPGYNTPTGMQEITRDEAVSIQQDKINNPSKYNLGQAGVDSLKQQLATIPAVDAPSGYVIGPGGAFMTAESAANFMPSPQELAAGVKPTGKYAGSIEDGSMIQLTNGAIVPKGSAGDVNRNNIAPAPTGTLLGATGTLPTPTTALQPGSTDTASVKQLQDYLISQGLMTREQVNTGYGTYGPQTTAAVAALQQKLGVDNSTGVGYFGPRTIAALGGQKSSISLPNGQTVFVDNNGGFSDAQGNPISVAQVAAAKAGAITSSSLSSTATPMNFQQANTGTSAANTLAGMQATYAQMQAQLAATQAATPKEKEYSDLTKILTDLNNQGAERSAYQTEQENAFGVTEKTKAVNDLQIQMQTILNEHAAAQLQTQQGQGVTTQIDSRQRDEETRQSAIKALGLNSLIAAAENSLSYAQSQANKAVETKFSPIEAKIKAATANLQLIASDPETTREDKARADAQLAIQNQMKEAVDLAKDNYSQVLKISIDAASNSQNFIATSQFRTLSQALQAMQDAQNPQEALQIADSVGLTGTPVDPLDTQLQKLQIQKAQQDLSGVGVVGGLESVGGTTPISTVSTITGKPLTDAERTASGFATRLVEADATIDRIGSQFTSVLSSIGQFLPNILKSADRQQFEQAKRNFVNAVLRRESGAVISEEEFANADKQYFPQPGDTVEVLAQKDSNRATVIRNLQLSGGQASTDPLGIKSNDPLGIR